MKVSLSIAPAPIAGTRVPGKSASLSSPMFASSAPTRITMERRIHVCAGIAADLLDRDLESCPWRIMRLSSRVVVNEKCAKLWPGQPGIGGHSGFEWMAEIDDHACLAQNDQQPSLIQQTHDVIAPLYLTRSLSDCSSSDRHCFRHLVLKRPLSQRVDVWSSDVLGTESEPDHPRRDSAQNWEIS